MAAHLGESREADLDAVDAAVSRRWRADADVPANGDGDPRAEAVDRLLGLLAAADDDAEPPRDLVRRTVARVGGG